MPNKKPTKPAVTKSASSGRVTPKKALVPTPVKEWKKPTLALELPSGKIASARNPGMKAFLSAGLIPNSLIPIVTEALSKGESPSGGASNVAKRHLEKKLNDQLKADPKMIQEILEAIDNITVYCFLTPKVHPVPVREVPDGEGGVTLVEAPEDKQDDELYVDDVDFEDKVFVFNWAVGGTRDLAKFRQ